MAQPADTEVGPAVKWIEDLPVGPFVRLGDGRIFAVEATSALVSADDGQSWSQTPLFPGADDQYKLSNERALIRTSNGTLVLAFLNLQERQWAWDTNTGEPGPDVTLPTYVTRSENDGETWEPPQKLHDDWTGAIRDIIETSDGTLIFTSMKILRNPGRHGCLTYRSTDDGQTWRASNLLDLGGHGHHDGTLEPTLVQLRDGRLWMLIRTTHDVFYESYSHDVGLTWSDPEPTGIDASTAPGMLSRLDSGRLVLIWNRLAREDGLESPRRGGDNQWSARQSSNQRQELSFALSDDDGRTWTEPAVIVRRTQKEASYPYLFEAHPGQLWITTMRGGVAVRIDEDAFADRPAKYSAAAPSD